MRTRTFYGGLLLISLTILMGTTSILATSVWSVNERDIYYVIWTHHPADFGAIPAASPTSPVYEKVNVTYSGSALAAHEPVPTTFFHNSINVTGEIWDGTKWNDISYGESTQLVLYNGTYFTWFCGGLFSGVPVIAPNGITENEKNQTLYFDADLLWSGSISMSESSSSTPVRWSYTNGENLLTVGYEADGFLQYYYLKVGNNIFECTCQRNLPNLPTVTTTGTETQSSDTDSDSSQIQIDGYNVQGLVFVIAASIWVLIRKSKK